MITLVKNTIDNNDIDRLIEWLKTYPRLTKGPVTKQFEKKWSDWQGCRHTIFCNSGSSANLLMFQTLIEAGRLKVGDKVVVPALSWATDLSPVIQLGLEPIICDVNLNDLSVDVENLEQIFTNTDAKCLILVSVLGLSPKMKEIVDLCEKYNVTLLEDACESMGTLCNGEKLGNFGVMSSFSTYFGHHMSTIEGGLVCTSDNELANICTSIRSHGWDRDLPENVRESLRKEWNVSKFDALYTFYYSGFNVRSTDLQAYIGLSQIDKLDNAIEMRNYNYSLYRDNLKVSWWPKNYSDTYISNFAIPLIEPNREKIVSNLINNNIEVRPLICGSMPRQPFYKKYINSRSTTKLPNASTVDKFGFYVPNHPELTKDEILFVCEKINEVV